MAEACSYPSQAVNLACELHEGITDAPKPGAITCPACHQPGKTVPGQTVKALLAISLRSVADVDYRFCRTRGCPVVYFASPSGPTHTTTDMREQVYQKEPEHDDVFVCYCFRHTVGELREAGPDARVKLVSDITDGIQAEQCACDLRNPQGSCCLGNVRALIKRLTEPHAGRIEQDV